MEFLTKIVGEYQTAIEKLVEHETNLAKKQSPVSGALKESIFQYIALVLILLSNYYPSGDWNQFFGLMLAFAVFLFSGWVKKIAELKINELLALAGLKDKQILILKEVKAKLESEIERLTDKLNELTLGENIKTNLKPTEPT